MEAQVKELCFIYHKRNVLGKERDRIRHKHRYLQDIKNLIKKGEKVPRTYKDKTLSDMNLMILDSTAKLANIKADVMRHTHKYDKRVKHLLDYCNASPYYVCGVVSFIKLGYVRHDSGVIVKTSETVRTISAAKIKEIHDHYIGDLEVEKMLRD